MTKAEYCSYWAGRLTTRFVMRVTKVGIVWYIPGTVVSGYKQVKHIAKIHKIATDVPSVVTDNVFDCLKYID